MGKGLHKRDRQTILARLNRYFLATEHIPETGWLYLAGQHQSRVSPDVAGGRGMRMEQSEKESAGQRDYGLSTESAREPNHVISADSGSCERGVGTLCKQCSLLSAQSERGAGGVKLDGAITRV